VTDEQRFEKWLTWFKKIKVEAQNLVMYRTMFKEIIEIIDANPKLHEDNQYYRYMNDSHIAMIVMGLRRQIKIDNQSISFIGLLNDLKNTPHLLSRKYYTDLYSDSSISRLADEHFDQFCDEPDDPYISTIMINADIDEFLGSTRLVEQYSDRFLAHTDKRGSKELSTFDDIDNCLQILDKLYCKYHVIFYAKSLNTLMPTFQYHWKKIFEIAWVNNEE